MKGRSAGWEEMMIYAGPAIVSSDLAGCI